MVLSALVILIFLAFIFAKVSGDPETRDHPAATAPPCGREEKGFCQAMLFAFILVALVLVVDFVFLVVSARHGETSQPTPAPPPGEHEAGKSLAAHLAVVFEEFVLWHGCSLSG